MKCAALIAARETETGKRFCREVLEVKLIWGLRHPERAAAPENTGKRERKNA